jgi:hypothetical protein
VLGIIFGFVARGQIKRSAGAEQGSGIALAGIIVGFAFLALLFAWLVIVALVAATGNSNN